MITAACRTCHQNWTMDQLPEWQTTRFFFARGLVLETPCEHGRFVGWSKSYWGVIDASSEDETGFVWDWQDVLYDQQRQIFDEWEKQHPHPGMVLGSPPVPEPMRAEHLRESPERKASWS